MTTTVPSGEQAVPDEDHSTGTAWRTHRPTPPQTGLPAHIVPCTPDEQARHLADLDEAISTWVYRPTDKTARKERRP